MKPVTTIPGETGSTSTIGMQVERAFSLKRVKYSLGRLKKWNNRVTVIILAC